MKVLTFIVVISFSVFAGASIVYAMHNNDNIAIDPTISFFKKNAEAFQLSLHQLEASIETIGNKNNTSISNARKALQNARLTYKAIEFFTEYFFDHTANIYNRPPAYEIEAAGAEYEDPIGLQVVEDMLAAKNPYPEKEKLLYELKALTSSADDITSLLYNLKITDAQILESVRLELLRISTLGITGYDAPFLKSGLKESKAALDAIAEVLQPFLATTNPQLSDSITSALTRVSVLLTNHPDFNSFDRLAFYTTGMFPLQQLLTQMIQQLNLDLNTTGAVNYNASTFFSPDFFNKSYFLPAKTLPEKYQVELGKRLFFDKGLSQNKMRSCASCHQPDKYFTDGLATNTSLSGIAIKRNSPSLLYAVYQYAQFLDGRENNLEDQAQKVITNATEMNGNPHNIIRLVRKNPGYVNSFNIAFPNEKDPLTFTTVSQAIAAYETTLTPFNSPFDRYIAGDKTALSKQQQTGFNLFTGKAQCATCHFIPLFNGLTPPVYQTTEFEILGIPANDYFAKPVADKDSGRYYQVPLPFTIGSFKTPTVRNAAVTAPYMHNGSLHSLEKVMDFYNRGGGEGIGVKIAYQTLSAKKLRLTQTEIKAVISFIHSLTDKSVNPG